ncbi:MAG: electron transfer flavoprotein-ubiquinone oxidoreductase [Gammaproteobacteria bacterium]
MDFDVVIVGAGPAGLAAACRLQQLALEAETELSVVVLEKGSEVGAHILSGAVIEPRALDELFPDWQQQAPLKTSVAEDKIYFLTGPEKSFKVPEFMLPRTMRNHGNYIASLGNLCRWLAQQAEAMEIEIFPGFAAAEVLYHDDGSVKGVATGDVGISASGEHKDSFEPGMELHAKYTIFAEGCRGHLGKQLIDKFDLARNFDPQHYGIGLKELWEIKPEQHQQGLVIHGSGWPLSSDTLGGFFLYHLEDNQVAIGLIVDLNYANPYLSPYDEFQRLKHHPVIKHYLQGGNRISYGARAITKGGMNSLPEMVLPGALLIGCDAGTLNFAKIKGTHTAMKSGMLAAEAIIKAITDNEEGKTLTSYTDSFRGSWLYDELYRARNFAPAMHKFGPYLGSAFNWLDQNIFKGKLPITLHDRKEDHLALKPANACERIDYPKHDGVISFDKLSSVYLSNTNHEEDQPCHLQLNDTSVPIGINLAKYAAPEQFYCPADVYEIIEDENKVSKLQINAQNCLHCKTCDIKDLTQNIRWAVPEGGGGPNYPNM